MAMVKHREVSLQNFSILLIEDEKELAELMRECLSHLGYKVILATNGSDGIWKVKNQKFNLIITDLNMPRCSGLDLVKFLSDETKSHINLNHKTPVIVLSAFIDSKSIEELQGKVTKVFTKPIDYQFIADFISKNF